MDPQQKIEFVPYIRAMQRIAMYETKSRFYIVGSNNSETQFRVLKVDRTLSRDLAIVDDNIVYNKREISELLQMVDVGNRSKIGQKIGTGMNRTTSAFGIVGFVRFLEGYYIILINKRRRAAMIGHHCIYKIEDTSMVYIPNEEVREQHPDEPRYVKMFQAIDMSSNFYYSYSYDLTNTLQYNLKDPKTLETSSPGETISDLFDNETRPSKLSYISSPVRRYMWNEYHLNPVWNKIHQDWLLPIIHGFVDQSNISIYGTPILLTLIARRSTRFAGTRFLKRGANFEGDVANEVETEQIVNDSSVSHLKLGNVTSFVQLRGSVPAHWAQDISKMAKPPIFRELSDPNACTAGKHFDRLISKYGSPIICLNLVKKREKRRHESILAEEFLNKIETLNTFLPPTFQLQYVHFDMAKCKKRHDTEVMGKLAEIAYNSVKKTGIFHNQQPYSWHREHQTKHAEMVENYHRGEASGCRQTGVVRTNCVDCLDRTNTAQFVVAKSALGLQLYALGYLESPHLEFDSDCARMLEAMYEDHGDTLALQYGGSQLIHRIKSYRSRSKWTSRANDITQTVRRYYSNTLSDEEKQRTMNLFLGIFRPEASGQPAIWECLNDTYHHLPQLTKLVERTEDEKGAVKADLPMEPCTQWWNPALREILPYSLEESVKTCQKLYKYEPEAEKHDLYTDYYRPFELTVMSDLYQVKDVSHSVRDYMPNFCTDFSPFVVRERAGKRHEEASNSSTKNNFNPFQWKSSGAASSASINLMDSEDEDDDDDDDDSDSIEEEIEASEIEPAHAREMTFERLFRPPGLVYGPEAEAKEPPREAIEMYNRFSSLDAPDRPNSVEISLISELHNYDEMPLPPVDVEEYRLCFEAPKIPSEKTLEQFLTLSSDFSRFQLS